jgi:hypothetical protein
MSEIGEEIVDGKNGVVCWFYVYKKINSKSSICGIVIIKKVTDDTNNIWFFYTETNIESGNKFKNDDLSFFINNVDLKNFWFNMEDNFLFKNFDINEFKIKWTNVLHFLKNSKENTLSYKTEDFIENHILSSYKTKDFIDNLDTTNIKTLILEYTPQI